MGAAPESLVDAETLADRFVLPRGWKCDRVGYGEPVRTLAFSRIDGTATALVEWWVLPSGSGGGDRPSRLRELVEDYRGRMVDAAPGPISTSRVVGVGSDLQFEYAELYRHVGLVRARDLGDAYLVMDYREALEAPDRAQDRGRRFFEALVVHPSAEAR